MHIHNSPIYDECQTQVAKVLAVPGKQACQDNSNDTSQHIVVDFARQHPYTALRTGAN